MKIFDVRILAPGVGSVSENNIRLKGELLNYLIEISSFLDEQDDWA